MTILARYPFARQTSASAGPVLPPVYSTTVVPGATRPSRSAPSIIASAIRSFIEPVGFTYSSFTQSSAPFSGASAGPRSRTSGVFPIAARMVAALALSFAFSFSFALVLAWRFATGIACGRYRVTPITIEPV